MAYLAGQKITTAGNRIGAFTGDADLEGNPYVRFDSGALYAVRRDGIPGVLVHFFGSTGEAYDYSQSSDAVRDGDVLLVPDEGVAAVLYGAWPVAINEPHDVQYGAFHGFEGGPDALAARGGGQYAESVRIAREVIAAHSPDQPLAAGAGSAGASLPAAGRRGAGAPAPARTAAPEQASFPAVNPLAAGAPGTSTPRRSTGGPAARPRPPIP